MKIKLTAGILLAFAMLMMHTAEAQIIDDSTKVIYGPRTTLQLFEKDILEGKTTRQRVDTLISNMHNERFWYHDTAYYQHLGNVGTAAKPLLFRMPDEIGVRFGRNTFDRYAYDPETINYYDTRSPYSHLYYIQGQRGEQVFEGTYARNINKRWNAGVAYQILTSNKQIGFTNRRDGLVDNKAAKFFSHYSSENERLDIFFNYTLLRHEQIEFGGIRPQPGDTRDDLFGYETEDVNLNQAASNESRNNIHLTSIFKLAGENLKVFNTFDWKQQVNSFEDAVIQTVEENGQTRPVFYPNSFFASDRTNDENTYNEFQNQVGFTGNSKISLYKAYLTYRNAHIDYSVLDRRKTDSVQQEVRFSEDAYFNQLFVGGLLRLFYENKAELNLEGVFQLSKDYHVKAQGKIGWLKVSQQRLLRSPSLLEESMISNHFLWDNDSFKSSVYDRTDIEVATNIGGRQHIRLSGNFTNIKRYVFFNENAVPEQLDYNQRLLGAEIAHQIRFGPIHFDNFVAYTNTEDADKIRIPKWLFDSKLYYQGFIFKKALYGQFGVQAYMPKGYFADAYMPVTQQFYLQNNFYVNAYPVVDVFVNADIKTLNVFLKMSHVNDELLEPGYFVTPFYPGMRRSFIFGLKWMFFD